MANVQKRCEKPSASSFAAYAWSAVAEVLLIFLLFFLYAGCPAPDVNEAHYLGKAKHYWDPAWCQGDVFLDSADAHLVFYWSVGWLTKLMPLAAVAWVGRLATWLLLAIAWWRLVRALIPQWGYALFAAGIVVCLWDRFHLAGEWVVGGFEAKGIAHALLFVALEKLIRGRWVAACWILGAAASFHVLVGGWGMLAMMFVMLVSRDEHRPRRQEMILGLVGGAALSLPGLLPALQLTAGTVTETAQRAAEIYVARLAHHLEIYKIAPLRVALFFALLLSWIALTTAQWRSMSGEIRRVQWFVAATILFATIGAGLDYFSLVQPVVMRLLRFYWFRLADVMVPIGVTLFIVGWLAARRERFAGLDSAWVFCAALILVAGCFFQKFLITRSQPCPPAFAQGLGRETAAAEVNGRWQDWRDVCHWVARSTPRDARFLTPPTSQTFKWYANRPEVAVGKDVPQDAAAIINWRNRLDDIDASRIYSASFAPTPQSMRDLADRYEFQYIIIEHGQRISWPLVYRNATFAVYQHPFVAGDM